MKDEVIGKRLKRLRIECMDEKALRRICMANKNCLAQNIPNKCDGSCDTCVRPNKERLCVCYQCSSFEGISGNNGAKIGIKALGIATNAKKTGIEKLESGLRTFQGSGLHAEYIKIFGEDRVNECIYNGGSVFKRNVIFKPQWCLCRDNETARLNEMIKQSPVTIICGDGGVGKTTLAKEFLSRLCHENYIYYDTILFSNKESFDEDLFLYSIKLNEKGKSEFEKYTKENKGKEQKLLRKEFISSCLDSAFVSPVFLLDDFALVDDDIFSLQEKYPNCRFIVTTRQVKDIGNNYEESVLKLDEFSYPAAKTVFNAQRRECGAKELNDKEFEPVYEFCKGNAEVLYFIVKMLGERDISRFEEFIKERKFSAKNKKTGEVEKSDLSEKLKVLFGFGEAFLPYLDSETELTSWQRKIAKALAVLSITEMVPVLRESILQFLTGDEKDDSESDECLVLLRERGFVKSDTEGHLFMHPLMCNALRLNGIGSQITDEVIIFAASVNGCHDTFSRFLLTLVTKDKEKIVFPRGIKEIPYFEASDKLKEIYLERDVTFWECLGLKKCRNLTRINVSDENEAFKSIDGSLFSKDGKTLVRYAIGKREKEYAIPNGVEKIGENAFGGCEYIEKIVVSEGVTEIGYSAFEDCARLEAVELPSSVKSIQEGAFLGTKISYSENSDVWSDECTEHLDKELIIKLLAERTKNQMKEKAEYIKKRIKSLEGVCDIEALKDKK